MPSDRSGEPWTGATYNGFSGPTAAEPPRPAERPHVVPTTRPAISTRNLMIGGVAAAVALGLVFGLWARTPSKRMDRLSSTAEAATPASVPIEVSQPPPMTLPQNTGRMEVLAPDQVQAARASAPMIAAAPRMPAPAMIQSRDVAAIAPQIDDPPLPPLRRGAINCGAPASAAEASICEDAGLAPERRLSRAERRALRDGYAPEPALRAPPRYQPDDEPADEEPSDPGA
jgi:hypothetical protein